MDQTMLDSSRETFIKAMRHVACSVTVVTTDGVSGRHGATVSAFSSATADPPTVLICLRAGSRISEQVQSNGCFTVNVLSEENRDIARAFTGEFDALHPDRFHGLSLVEMAGLAPGLRDATIFACRTAGMVTQGSHNIFFGEVIHASTEQRPPLTYHDGAYRSLRPLVAA